MTQYSSVTALSDLRPPETQHDEAALRVQLAAAYRIFYRRAEDPNYTYYLMDHTSFVYLLDPAGKVVSLFRYGTSPDEMAAIIRQHMRG